MDVLHVYVRTFVLILLFFCGFNRSSFHGFFMHSGNWSSMPDSGFKQIGHENVLSSAREIRHP